MAEVIGSLSTLTKRVNKLLETSLRLDALTAAATDSATTITVTDYTIFSKDTRLEIDDEVMIVAETPTTVTVSVKRGYEGTDAAAHDSGSEIRLDPRFLRSTIKEAINVVLNDWISIYMPRLSWDSSSGGTFEPTQWIYNVPAEATKVRGVAWMVPGHTLFDYLPHGPLRPYPTAICASGQGVEIFEMGLPGRNVYVYYETPWPYLDDDDDTIPDDFPKHGEDLIVTGATLYLLGWRVVPKFRLDEVVFHREAGGPTPPNISMTQIVRMQQDWLGRIQRVCSERAGGESRKVFV